MFLVLMPFNLNTAEIKSVFPYFDKVAHFAVSGFMVLALSTFMSIRKAVLLSFLLMTGSEFAQLYMPNRGASIGDFLANTGGILGFWFLETKGWLTFLRK